MRWEIRRGELAENSLDSPLIIFYLAFVQYIYLIQIQNDKQIGRAALEQAYEKDLQARQQLCTLFIYTHKL